MPHAYINTCTIAFTHICVHVCTLFHMFLVCDPDEARVVGHICITCVYTYFLSTCVHLHLYIFYMYAFHLYVYIYMYTFFHTYMRRIILLTPSCLISYLWFNTAPHAYLCITWLIIHVHNLCDECSTWCLHLAKPSCLMYSKFFTTRTRIFIYYDAYSLTNEACGFISMWRVQPAKPSCLI